MSGEFDSAEVTVVAVGDDPGATKAVHGVTVAMTDRARCRFAPLERIVEHARGIPPLADWATEFERRYLHLTPVT